MPAKPTTPQPTEVETATGIIHANETLHLEGDSIDRLAKLGAQATGVEIALIKTPASFGGLPDFPVGIRHGDQPGFISLKNLAEEWRGHPEDRRGVAKVGDIASFSEMTNRHKLEESVIFAQSDWRKPSLTAVIDYHALDAHALAGFGRHRIHYDFPFSDEWNVWLKHDGKPMNQTEFAEFMEERSVDMTTLVEAENGHFARELQVDRIGSPIQIFELARGLEINVGGKVKQNLKLQSGEAKISFEEEHTGRDGAPITVPGAFALSIPLFYNEEPITIPVRLRYRVVGGAILWIYKLFRVDRIVAEAVRRAKQDVKDATGLPVYEGNPEMLASGATVNFTGGA